MHREVKAQPPTTLLKLLKKTLIKRESFPNVSIHPPAVGTSSAPVQSASKSLASASGRAWKDSVPSAAAAGPRQKPCRSLKLHKSPNYLSTITELLIQIYVLYSIIHSFETFN